MRDMWREVSYYRIFCIHSSDPRRKGGQLQQQYSSNPCEWTPIRSVFEVVNECEEDSKGC